MNDIFLRGTINNIQFSHSIGDTEYQQANLIVNNTHRDEPDTLVIKFKKFNNRYQNGDLAEIKGNIRSYSEKINDNKNKVNIYVFTYQYLVEENYEQDNIVQLDGRICKRDILRITNSGKHNFHFTLANNIIIDETKQKVNSYIPCVVWGKLAKEMSDKLDVNSKILVKGELHSRQYRKQLDNNDFEIRVAQELIITEYSEIE